jgi:hypothetical protein
MRKKFTLLVILTLALTAGVQAQNLVMKTKDGTILTKQLGTVKRITFSNNSMLVNYLGSPVETYSLSNISKLSFKSTITGVDQPSLSSTRIISIYPNPAKDVIYLVNTPDNAFTVSIYRMNGVLVLSTPVSSTSKSINVNYLSGGLYLLKVNEQTFKFIKL